MNYYVQLPVADMREKPTETSKLVSQALFGEGVHVHERMGGWASVVTPDGYSGWLREDSLIARSEPYHGGLEITRLKGHVYAVPDTEYGPFVTLPYGSKLKVLDQSDPRWIRAEWIDGRVVYVQKGDVVPEKFDPKKFLGLPYTWGGRSSFGYDCSGFVQMVYARLGVQLPRDARLQIAYPSARPIRLEELAYGDLIFWGTSEKEIKHVGMCLERPEFIHTSVRENKPYLRISSLNDLEWSGTTGAYYPFRAQFRIDKKAVSSLQNH